MIIAHITVFIFSIFNFDFSRDMIRKYLLSLSLLLSFNLLLAQTNDKGIFQQAMQIYEEEKYSLAQHLFNQVYTNKLSTEVEREQSLFYLAICSKNLFNEDAEFWFDEFLDLYPYSSRINEVNYELALFYFRQSVYEKAIYYFLRCDNNNNEFYFKTAYSYFMLDSLESSKYYFGKLIGSESKYAASSTYFYAHIAYKQKHYKTALSNFLDLKKEKNFSAIVPYYITQIYFLQKKYDDLIIYTIPVLDKVISSREAELNRIIAEAYYRKKEYINSVNYFEVFFQKTTQSTALDKLQIGHAYHNIHDYENAIRFLEPLQFQDDSSNQFAAYYLANSYLNIDEKAYAIKSFKKAADYDYNLIIKEDAYFNYAKLSYELDLPFENVLDVLQSYLTNFNDAKHKKIIKNLMINAFQNTNRYEQAFEQLKEIELPTIEQKTVLQRLSFFIGVKAFNNLNYKEAVTLFEFSNQYKINDKIFAMSTYHLADCYYHIVDFEKSINLYNDFLSSSLGQKTIAAQYNLGYAYFKQSDYQKAKNSFRKFTRIAKDSMRLNDAYLRTADCYFMLSDFRLAIMNYSKAINYNLFDSDYAIYNQSVCCGLIGKSSAKVKLLKQLEENYKQSTYYDDALLDLAVYYKNSNQENLAIAYYDSLFVNTSEIEMKANVHLSKGMIFLNTNEIDKAITSFKIVLNEYANTTSFKEALSGLRAAYVSIAKVDEYLAIVNELPQISISKAEQDSLTFNTAFMKFVEGDFVVSNTTFQQYLSNFEQGIFALEANYYLAESCKNLKDTICAIKHFKYVVKSNQKHLEAANLYLARHYYSKNKLDNSNTYYQNLERIATNNNVKREAIIRLMLGFETKENQHSVSYAQKTLELDKLDETLRNKANIILARNYFANGNFSKAENTFSFLGKIATDKVGAEATYMIAYLNYLNDSLRTAENTIYQLANDFTSDYWIAKGFILLSDIYSQRGNAFQAKATLKSIIENYEGEDLLIVARKNYENILQSEIVDTTSIQEPECYINIYDDEINYEVLFEEEIDTSETPKIIENE